MSSYPCGMCGHPHVLDTICERYRCQCRQWTAKVPSGDQYGRRGDGPFCEEQWDRGEGTRLLVCQRGPKHVAEDRPHKDVTGLLWSDEERSAGVLR